jgi:RNA polymerase sigma-70 factor, ECF subfamily
MHSAMPLTHSLSLPLASAFAAGDRTVVSAEAFRAFVAREGDRWLRLAVRLAGEADGADVLQEALVKAWVAFGEGQGPTGFGVEASRWVVRVVVNQAFDTVRARARRRRWASVFASVFPSQRSAEPIEAAASVRELERLLERLTAEQRIAWVLKEVEGYSGAEIASLTGVSEGAVEQRLVRARTALQKELRREA